MKPLSQGCAVLIPSIRGAENPSLSGLLVAVATQTSRPQRILLLDMAASSGAMGAIEGSPAIARLCDFFHVEVLHSPRLTTSKALSLLMRESSSEWAWILPDDLIPAPDCLENLWTTAAVYDAALVSGVKQEVTRREPWGQGGDWNRMNRPFAGVIELPWADSANLLVKSEVWTEADQYDPGDGLSGEDVVTTARLGQKHTILGCGEAVAFHVPFDEHRWDTREGDERCLEILEEELSDEHLAWFRRSIERAK